MMRRSVLLLSLPVAWMACFSNSSGGPGGGAAFDASSDSPAFDSTAPDGEQEAAAMDAATEAEASPAVDSGVDVAREAGPSPVVVTVVGALGLESGISIVWNDAAGVPIATTTTGATGSTTQLVGGGGAVTALLGTPSSPSLYTILGVEPGDNLVVIDRGSIASLPSTNADLTAVPSPLPTNATGLTFSVGQCNNGLLAPPSILSLSQGWPQGCIGIGQFGASFGAAYPALVEANDSSFVLQGFVFAKNNGLTMDDDAGYLDLNLGAASWALAAPATTTEQTLTVINEADAGIYTPWSLYEEVANGVVLPLAQRSPQDGGTLAAGSTLYTTHKGYADFVQTEVGYEPSNQGFVQQGFAVATRGPAPTADATTTVDWSALGALPSLIGVTVDGTVSAQPKISWTTQAGTLGSSTGVIVYATWSGTDPEGGVQNGSWTIVSAGTAQSSLQAPALPAADVAWQPVAGSTFGIPATVYAIQGGTVLPTYAQMRAAAGLFTLQTGCIFGPMAPPLPVAGTLVMSGYTSGGCG